MKGLGRRRWIGLAAAAATLSGGSAIALAVTGTEISSVRAALSIDGTEVASFSELTSISMEVEPTEYLEAGPDGTVLKLIGKAKPILVTLKRGQTEDLTLWAWHDAVRRGDLAAARKSATIVMYNANGAPTARYHLEHGWPSKLVTQGVPAKVGQTFVENVTIVAEGLQRVAP